MLRVLCYGLLNGHPGQQEVLSPCNPPFIPLKEAERLSCIIALNMALSSLLRSESANFSDQFDRSFVHGCGLNQTDLGFGASLGDSANFAVKPLGDSDEPDSKIEFLHGTTTLAFKVSL